MLYETRMDRVNKYRDEKRIRDICEKLNEIVYKIANINPEFKCYGAKEDGYYDVYNKNKYGDRRIDLSFRLCYPDKDSFLYDKKAKNFWTKNKFIDRRDLEYGDKRVRSWMCKEFIYKYDAL